jgi:hypothetical protein
MCSKDLCSHEIRDSVATSNQADRKLQASKVMWLDASNDPEHPSSGPSSGAFVWQCTSEQVGSARQHLDFSIDSCSALSCPWRRCLGFA